MQPKTLSRLAGLSYFGIILSGLTAEIALRGPILGAADPAIALADQTALWRGSMALDLVMLTLDAALAFLLFHLLRPFGVTLAGAALGLRFAQMAVIAAHLPLLAAVLTAADPVPLIERHGIGYDVGLWFFGLNSLVMAALLARAGARKLSILIGAAGLVYLIGTMTRLAAPEINAFFQPAYLIAVVAEVSLAIWLLRGPKVLTSAQG